MRHFGITLFVFAIAISALAKKSVGAIAMGDMGDVDGTPAVIDFTVMGQVNPTVTIGDTTVSFGSAFVGQVVGSQPNVLTDTTPDAPLRLDPNAPDVMTLFEITAGEVVLGGADNGRFLTTPLAILFSDPVKDVFFDLGHLDAPGTAFIQAYDADGNTLGTLSNPSAGWQTIVLSDSSGTNLISGVSIYVPEGGMDWEGFAIDKIGFGFSEDGTDSSGGPDDGVIPEPSAAVVWGTFILFGLTGAWIRRTKK